MGGKILLRRTVNLLDPVLKNRGILGRMAGHMRRGQMSVLKEILGPISKKNGYRFMPVLLTKRYRRILSRFLKLRPVAALS